MIDLCKYVNVFHGCGEIDLPKAEGIAAKWFFLKAGCGNTSPAATVPFGGMSVAPFSGGYPTGYGNHRPNSHSRPAKFENGEKLLGFAHLQQSGTGAIEYYYNYGVTTPRYNDSPQRRIPENESAVPGYYSCVLEDIKCELTANSRTALHRYSFGKSNGMINMDFSNNGLVIPDVAKKEVDKLTITQLANNTISVTMLVEGINIYFAVKSDCDKEITKNGIIYYLKEKTIADIAVAISLKSIEAAVSFLDKTKDFETTKNEAYLLWNKELNKIRIETQDDKIKRIFYSNLYHSLVKPADYSGESYLYETGKPFLTDLATLWDMYKTSIPLIYMINKDIGEKLVETLLLAGENLDYVPNCMSLSDKSSIHDIQARMLGDYVLITAYRYGVKIDPERMVNVIRKDVFSDNKKDFTVDHKCKSHTWFLDMADACALTCQVAKEIGQDKIAEELYPLAQMWKTVYDENTGLLKNDSDYYEGTLYNYSFRQMVEMDERIKIAGGKDNFVKLLDDFFGYEKADVILPTDPFNYQPVAEGYKLGRFEGFNNESDTETPYSYIYAGRQDKTCEIIRAGMKYMFSEGKGGLPGNNDTCALSSYYVLAALGIFPVAGQDLFLIGSPLINTADIDLFNGNTIKIKAINNSDENIYVKTVSFNNNVISDFKVKASELLKGGELVFEMTSEI